MIISFCAVEATGKTKEEAEQEAAMLLLTEKLKLTSLPLMELTEPPSSDETEPADVSETDDFELEEIRNPIGELMTRFEKKKLLDLQFLVIIINIVTYFTEPSKLV